MGGQWCRKGCGAVNRNWGLTEAGLSQKIPSRGHRLSPWHTPQEAAGTLISGTTILDSGFLSNMRVIRSFKSSAMSGLGGGHTSGVGDVTKGLEKVATCSTWRILTDLEIPRPDS